MSWRKKPPITKAGANHDVACRLPSPGAGRLVECPIVKQVGTDALFATPEAQYTRNLTASVPKLRHDAA